MSNDLLMNIEQKIENLANEYAAQLKGKIDTRVQEMEQDDNSHYLIYQVLGVTDEEGRLIDVYQNKGRFLYKYAGSFLEEAAILCFEDKFEEAQRKVKIPNTQGSRPRTFEIDCLVEKVAYEIKWRDATTDGDHITKEHARVKVISDKGYVPVRVMFYYPNRGQAIRIQQTLETLYAGIGGHYHFGDSAWQFIKEETNVDLLNILTKIAKKNTSK